MRHHLISRAGHLNTSGITPHGADSFRVKPITPGHPIPKISNVASCSVSLMLILVWGIDIFEKLTQEQVVQFESHPLHTPTLEGGNFMQSLSFLYIFCGDLHFDALIIGFC